MTWDDIMSGPRHATRLTILERFTARLKAAIDHRPDLVLEPDETTLIRGAANPGKRIWISDPLSGTRFRVTIEPELEPADIIPLSTADGYPCDTEGAA